MRPATHSIISSGHEMNLQVQASIDFAAAGERRYRYVARRNCYVSS